MITPPDELYSTEEAASLLGVDPRSVQRWLKAGKLAGVRFGREWRVPALALWRHTGIEADMLALWRDYCREEAAARGAAAQVAGAARSQPSGPTDDRSEPGSERIDAIARAEKPINKNQ